MLLIKVECKIQKRNKNILKNFDFYSFKNFYDLADYHKKTFVVQFKLG